MNIYNYRDILDGGQIVFVVFIVYYIIEEGIEISKHKLNYFKSVYNIMDLGVIGVSYLNSQ